MDEFNDSELKMVAHKLFDQTLQEIKNSGLNFQLQLSPFSAVISLKKSLVRDTAGLPILPYTHSRRQFLDDKAVNDLIYKNSKLEKDIADLQEKCKTLLVDHREAYEKIEILENDLKTRDIEVDELQTRTRMAQDSAVKVNKALHHCRSSFAEEKGLLLSEHKLEVKKWKKELGEATRKHLKLEKQFYSLFENEDIKSSNFLASVKGADD